MTGYIISFIAILIFYRLGWENGRTELLIKQEEDKREREIQKDWEEE